MKKNILLLLVVCCFSSLVFFGFKIFTFPSVNTDTINNRATKIIQDSNSGGTLSFTSSVFNLPNPQISTGEVLPKYPLIIEIFNNIQSASDYKNFSKFHPKDRIYVYAVKTKNKSLRTKLWELDYQVNNSNYRFEGTKDDFSREISRIYDDIISGKNIVYLPFNDLSIYFNSSNDIKYLESLCNLEFDNEDDKSGSIDCLNTLFLSKATPDNNLCERISEANEGYKNTKELCLEMIQ